MCLKNRLKRLISSENCFYRFSLSVCKKICSVLYYKESKQIIHIMVSFERGRTWTETVSKTVTAIGDI